jgi:NADP-dependent 3-hydroxy acid dehydrogenase YdfG
MASDGATVALVGRTASKVEAVQSEIEAAGGTGRAYGLDVSDRDAVFAMATDVAQRYGKIDVLLNNAGHSSPHRRLLNTTADEIESVIASNLLGTIYCTQAVMAGMLERDSGTIVNVASIAGLEPGVMGGMIYSTVKASIIAFTKSLNSEFAKTNIRATTISPGEIETPALDRRPVKPNAADRDKIAGADEVAEMIATIAGLPQRTAIHDLVIRPTWQRDTSAEMNSEAWQ